MLGNTQSYPLQCGSPHEVLISEVLFLKVLISFLFYLNGNSCQVLKCSKFEKNTTVPRSSLVVLNFQAECYWSSRILHFLRMLSHGLTGIKICLPALFYFTQAFLSFCFFSFLLAASLLFLNMFLCHLLGGQYNCPNVSPFLFRHRILIHWDLLLSIWNASL